eukprot:527501_1
MLKSFFVFNLIHSLCINNVFGQVILYNIQTEEPIRNGIIDNLAPDTTVGNLYGSVQRVLNISNPEKIILYYAGELIDKTTPDKQLADLEIRTMDDEITKIYLPVNFVYTETPFGIISYSEAEDHNKFTLEFNESTKMTAITIGACALGGLSPMFAIEINRARWERFGLNYSQVPYDKTLNLAHDEFVNKVRCVRERDNGFFIIMQFFTNKGNELVWGPDVSGVDYLHADYKYGDIYCSGGELISVEVYTSSEIMAFSFTWRTNIFDDVPLPSNISMDFYQHGFVSRNRKI